MQYREDKYKNPISLLGYGCMRFSHKGSGIDIDKAEKEILRGIELGINYFDTAYVYPGIEACLGEIIRRNPGIRNKMNIATKLPSYSVRSMSEINRIFDEELKRLNTDHIDYYLLHMLTDLQTFIRLRELGIENWIEEKKKSGQIRNIGFSYHGDSAMFLKLLDAYDWDFTQIQYNYLDEHTQAGRVGLENAYKRGIPVIIMEPLRGGRLVNMLPLTALEVMKESDRNWTAAEWGLKWLYDQEAVTCVLSGMNSLEMLEENVRIADETPANSLNDKDRATYEKIKQAINEVTRVGCTGCRYCMPCPKGVDIPSTFSCYNHAFTESKGGARKEYWQTVALRKDSALMLECVKCGKCEAHCPQKIRIREELENAKKTLLPWHYRIMAGVSRWFLFRK